MRFRGDKNVFGGGVQVGGPYALYHPFDDYKNRVVANFCVDVVLSRYATGIDKWSVAIDDRTLRHYTTNRLPEVIKDAITLIIPFADKMNLRNEVGTATEINKPYIWPEEYSNIGWYMGKQIWYPHEDYDSPVEEQLFLVIVNWEQLQELRARLDDLSTV